MFVCCTADDNSSDTSHDSSCQRTSTAQPVVTVACVTSAVWWNPPPYPASLRWWACYPVIFSSSLCNTSRSFVIWRAVRTQKAWWQNFWTLLLVVSRQWLQNIENFKLSMHVCINIWAFNKPCTSDFVMLAMNLHWMSHINSARDQETLLVVVKWSWKQRMS